MKIRLEPYLLLVLAQALSPEVHAQTWVTTTDDYIADEVGRAVQTRDGRFLAVADTGRALALIKRNSDGSLLWQRQLMGSPTGEAGYDPLELPDGRIVAAGDIHGHSHGNDDLALFHPMPGRCCARERSAALRETTAPGVSCRQGKAATSWWARHCPGVVPAESRSWSRSAKVSI